jgi:hypothetical protein
MHMQRNTEWHMLSDAIRNIIPDNLSAGPANFCYEHQALQAWLCSAADQGRISCTRCNLPFSQCERRGVALTSASEHQAIMLPLHSACNDVTPLHVAAAALRLVHITTTHHQAVKRRGTTIHYCAYMQSQALHSLSAGRHVLRMPSCGTRQHASHLMHLQLLMHLPTKPLASTGLAISHCKIFYT